jgi:ABC-type glycerol-3-phosphate transport system permease component
MKPAGTLSQRLLRNGWKQLVLFLFSLLCLFPLYYLFVTAFKTKGEYLSNLFGLPLAPILSNFVTVFRGRRFLLWFANSVILTGGSVAAGLAISLAAAYAFAKLAFRFREQIFGFLLVLMIIPPVVMVIPLFKLMIAMGILNTYGSVIIIYTGLTIPFSIYLLASFFRTVPGALVDSARIDGCRDLRVLLSIMVPLASPAIITTVLVNALWVWNELLIAVIFLQRDELKTLMVGLTIFKSRYNLDIPVTMAGLALATIPMLALYFAGQKYFIRGMVAGAVK